MFSIDKMSRTPIYEQLIRSLELSILSGEIPAEGQLPSVRSLSQQLSVNPNTLQKAYAEIERRGLCYTVPGSGRYIAADALSKLRTAESARLKDLEEALLNLRENGVLKQTVEAIVERVYSNETNQNERKVSEK